MSSEMSRSAPLSVLSAIFSRFSWSSPDQGTFWIRVGSIVLAAISVWTTLWVIAPELLKLTGWPATATQALLGYGYAAFGSAFIFDVVAVMSLRNIWSTGNQMNRELAATTDARRICLTEGPQLLARARPGQSPFFAAGFGGIARIETTAAYVMAENIRKDAESYRYEPIAMIIDRVIDRLTSGSAQLRDAQQMGLRLGILGTFVGMALALLQLNDIFAPGAGAEVGRSAIEAIIEQLYLAFGTSIAGLVSAILLQIVAWGLHMREQKLLDDFQELAVSIQAIYRSAELGQSIGVNMDLLKEEITEHRRDMASHKHIIGDYTQAMGNSTMEASRVFEKPLDAIRQTGERLSSLLIEQDGAMRSLGETTRSVSSLQAQVAGHFEAALQHAGNVQKEAFAGLGVEIVKMGEGLRSELNTGFQTDDRFTSARDLERSLASATTLLGEAIAQQKRVTWLITVLATLSISVLLVALGVGAWFFFHGPG